jgi:hypothetical protein
MACVYVLNVVSKRRVATESTVNFEPLPAVYFRRRQS